MMSGFVLVCLRCGASVVMKPGDREVRTEAVTFGWNPNKKQKYVTCRCGNELVDSWRYELDKENGFSLKVSFQWIEPSQENDGEEESG